MSGRSTGDPLAQSVPSAGAGLYGSVILPWHEWEFDDDTIRCAQCGTLRTSKSTSEKCRAFPTDYAAIESRIAKS